MTAKTSNRPRNKLSTRVRVVPEKVILKCRWCGWPWVPRTSQPRCCPRCYRINYDSGVRIPGTRKKARMLQYDYIMAKN